VAHREITEEWTGYSVRSFCLQKDRRADDLNVEIGLKDT
jgi:hypothetical protein